jgi:hypothetical protein
MKDLIINSKYSLRVSKPRLACKLIKINAQFNTACVNYIGIVFAFSANREVFGGPVR